MTNHPASPALNRFQPQPQHRGGRIFAMFFALLLLLLPPVAGQDSVPVEGIREVAIFEVQFGRGRGREMARFVIGLNEAAAPNTVANFKELVDRRFYNNMRFHRAFPNSLVQTGDPLSRRGPTELSGTGGPGYTIPAEIRLPHRRGAVAMARLEDRINPARASNGSQFFVCLEPLPQLNGKYTVFGQVLEGMDVLERISNSRTDSNDFPIERIVIRRVFVEPFFGTAPPTS